MFIYNNILNDINQNLQRKLNDMKLISIILKGFLF